MRRTVAVLALVLIAVTLSACGGDTAAPPNATSSTAPPPAAVPPGTAPVAAPTDLMSPTETVSNEAFPTAVEGVPTVILDLLGSKQPILLFFYDSKQLITPEQRAEVDVVIKKYRGLITLVAYDIRAESAAAGTSRDPEIQKALDLAGLLGVKHTPYVLIVDRYGRVTGRFAGYIDRKLIEREVLRAIG
jgi:hypothetical protein